LTGSLTRFSRILVRFSDAWVYAYQRPNVIPSITPSTRHPSVSWGQRSHWVSRPKLPYTSGRAAATPLVDQRSYRKAATILW